MALTAPWDAAAEVTLKRRNLPESDRVVTKNPRVQPHGAGLSTASAKPP